MHAKNEADERESKCLTRHVRRPESVQQTGLCQLSLLGCSVVTLEMPWRKQSTVFRHVEYFSHLLSYLRSITGGHTLIAKAIGLQHFFVVVLLLCYSVIPVSVNPKLI